MSYIYALSLLGILGCLLAIDKRYKAAFFYKPLQTLQCLAMAISVFTIWDLVGIHQGLFYTGQSRIISGITLAANFPVEELLFLTLLCYLPLLTYQVVKKR